MAPILKVDTIQDQSGNNIINENADTITIGASGDTVNIVGTLQNNGSALASGITMADQWRLTSNITGTDGFITANLERIDSSGQGTLGTGMTESSGVFTFPSTGIYYVAFNGRTDAVGADNISLAIFATINNSTYSEIAKCTNGFDTALGNLSVNSLIDVTDTSNVKVKFEVSSLNASSYLSGNTTRNETFMTFVRLGDT